MTALDLISLVNQVLFVGLFVAVLWAALKQPTRARGNATILFGAIALVVLLSRFSGPLGFAGEPWLASVQLLLLNLMPLAMLRLVDDFSGTPRWVQLAGLGAFAAVGVLGFLSPVTNEVVLLGTMAFFVAVGGYAALRFASESRRARGITRRRMAAVAVGAASFIAALVVVLLGGLIPAFSAAATVIGQLLALVAAVSFFFGFTPPSWVRLVWRDPDLRHFLERSTQLIGVSDEVAALQQIQAAAADAFGASGASIGVWDRDRRVLRYATDAGWTEYPDHAYVAGRAFQQQHRLVVAEATRYDPDNADTYERYGAHTIVAAPITAEDRRLGVLTLYAERSPIFAEDDVWLLDVLAGHIAVLLDARTLALKGSQLRAREDSARLKEEFLSAAAHDLRTPLTVVLGQAELLERRIRRDPQAPVDPIGVTRIVREAHRLRDLVAELLDAQRLEESRAVMRLEQADLREIVEIVVDRYREHGAPVEADVPEGPLTAPLDRGRIEQVIENLLENAVKYGQDVAPQVRAWSEDDEVRMTVVDQGIGIPETERDRVFERFFRASNAHSITDTGMGLGLFICRRIVEDHGGRIWYEPTPGGGSTFTIALPAIPSAATEPDERGEPLPAAATAEIAWPGTIAREAARGDA